MMGTRQSLGGDGRDAFSKAARRVYGYTKAGTLKWIKRRYARKARQSAKRDLRKST